MMTVVVMTVVVVIINPNASKMCNIKETKQCSVYNNEDAI